MTMRNLVRQVLEARKMTPYRFWRESGLARATAYRLVNDPLYIPGGEVWDRVCYALEVQPGELMAWEPDENWAG
jgi:DNA-binding Xre family transcriptional regulator